MPGIFHQPIHRRDFLHTTLLSGLALAVNGCRTAPTASSSSLRLALLSDTHIPGDRKNGHRGFNPWDNLKAVVPQVMESQPAGVMINGDAARLEGKLEDYQELKALLAPLAASTPVYIGLGNHDDRAQFYKVFPEPPGQRQSVGGKHVVVVEHPSVRVVVLDSLLYVNMTAGLLGKNQRTWLAKYLPEHRDRPVVLFVHHTLTDNDGDLLDADKLFDLCEPHRHVKAIFYGHSHVWSIGQQRRLRLVNLPAVGYNFRDQDPVGWVEAEFRGDGVSLTLRALAGNRADDGRTSLVRWG